MKNKQEKIKKGRVLKGVVTSDKMNKTIAVAVSQFKKHPKYEKRYVQVKKFKAHDESRVCKTGDRVLIQECRPVSKTKNWTVIKKL